MTDKVRGWYWASESKSVLSQMEANRMIYRRPGWYRVKFSGRWQCVEWKDPGEKRGGWQFGDRMDPQPWEDRDFEEIGDRAIIPDESPDDTLEDLIQKAIDLKQGDKEFLLAGNADHTTWIAAIGNTCHAVPLGEADPQFQAQADNPRDAVLQLIEMLEWPGRHD